MIHANSKSGPQHSFLTSSTPKPGHARDLPATQKFLQTMSDGKRVWFQQPWLVMSFLNNQSCIICATKGAWLGITAHSTSIGYDTTTRSGKNAPQELACLTLWRQMTFTTKQRTASKNYTNPIGGGMKATPGTSPATLTCRKIKSTSKSVYTKCCQKIKTKNLLETHSKYNSAAAFVPLTLICSLTGMCSSKT